MAKLFQLALEESVEEMVVSNNISEADQVEADSEYKVNNKSIQIKKS